jgi:M6 family metalloprotease-like protein
MSVQDYYHEISNGNLEVIGDDGSIVDWITVGHDYSYYVDGEQGTGSGAHGVARSAAALVVEIAMEHHSEIDFSHFDGDGDGAVDVVILIVEGWGNGANNQFWPHMSLIHSGSSGIGLIDSDAPTNDDGYFSPDGVVAIKKYIVIPEQFHMNYYGVGEYYIHPIGTICHELGHVLGIPDLYDTSDNSAAGIGQWGLMGAGNWQRQTSPAYMSAWSRYQLGFINPIIRYAVVNNEEILLPAESGEEGLLAMIIPMDTNMPQEYLILENRQQLGTDQYLEKSGLLVWHVDEIITGMYPAINSGFTLTEFIAGYIPVMISSTCHTNKPDFSKSLSAPNCCLFSKIKYSWGILESIGKIIARNSSSPLSAGNNISSLFTTASLIIGLINPSWYLLQALIYAGLF